jgi:cell division septation protein DedD
VDMQQSIVWLSKAADAGHTTAVAKLAELQAHPEALKSEPAEPMPWSQAWNLRLPDEIRYGPSGLSPREDDGNKEFYNVQLGTFESRASANRLWNTVRGPNTDLFEGLEAFLAGNPPGQQNTYQLRAGPFDSLHKAQRFCDQLVDRGVTTGCLPIRSTDNSKS